MEKKINIEYIFVHVFFQLMIAIVYGFGVYILMARGYNSAEAGMCMSIAGGLNLIGQPVISDFLDKSKKVSAFDAAIYLALLSAALFFINFLLPNKGILLSFVFVAGVFAFCLIEPLINSFCTNFVSNGLKIEFSRARAVGSLSYGAACLVFGFVAEVKPYTYIIISGVFFCFALGVINYIVRKDYYSIVKCEKVNDAESVDAISFGEFINHNTKYVLLCLAFTGIFVGYACIDNFMLLVMENVGGTSGDMGACLAYKAAVEAVALLLFPIISKKIDLNYLLKGAAIAFVIKAAGMYLAKSVLQVYIAQTFQVLSFGIMFPSMVAYINRYMDAKGAVRANAFLTMTICGGSMIASILAGSIANSYGTSAMELFALIITAVSALLFCLIVGNKKAQ